MTDTNKLVAALSQLDSGNTNHWTAEGLPRLDTLKMLAGDPSLTREQVTAAAPGYTRENRVVNLAAEVAAAVPPAATKPADPPAAPASVTNEGGDNGADDALAGGAASQEVAPSAAGQGAAPEEGELAGAQRVLAEALAAEEEAKRAVAKATATLDRLLEADAKSRPAVSSFAPVEGYLKSQQAAREARGARMLELKGIPLKDILPKPAPIDAAFARKTGFGHKRPTR
jgi:hypothetical protein